MFIFAFANGTLEAVANPLVATLFPNNRTHYLNILHASWPLGMILGAVVGWMLDDKMQIELEDAALPLSRPDRHLRHYVLRPEISRNRKRPQRGASLGEMFKDVGILGRVGRLLSALL